MYWQADNMKICKIFWSLLLVEWLSIHTILCIIFVIELLKEILFAKRNLSSKDKQFDLDNNISSLYSNFGIK